MNILMFNYEYPPLGGGGGVVHALIAEELARRHRVCVITSRFGGLPRRETRNDVEIVRAPVVGRAELAVASLVSMLSYPPAAWWEAARLLRRSSFDVINSHFAVPTGLGSLPCAKLVPLPHVLSLHGGDIYDPSKRLSPHRLPFVRSAVTAVMRHSDAVVAQSSNTRANAYRYYGYRGPIELIPLGIRQPTIPPVARDALGLPRDAFLGVTVGRLVARKRIEQLLTALARPDCAAVHLLVVGSGPELGRLQALTRDLGLGSRVTFAGQVSEERKWQLLQVADVYLSATMHEGFGLVYLEAMAAGLPVITYDEGGQVDFLSDGETGYLIPAGNEAALAAALTRALRCREKLREMGAANRRRAPAHRIEHCAAAYESLFQRVIARAPADRRRPATVPGP